MEVTEKVIGARRLETLRKLGVRALETRTIETACENAATVLAENPSDCPFAAIYARERRRPVFPDVWAQ